MHDLRLLSIEQPVQATRCNRVQLNSYAKDMAGDAQQDTLGLLTASELARALGVSPSTVWNWTRRDQNPLKTVMTADGAIRFTWVHLDEFCRANPSLRAVSRLGRRASSREPLPVSAPVTPQMEELKSIARDLRNAANESFQAALEAARLAEESARSHRLQVESFGRMMAAYEAALANITAPSTIND